MAGEEEDRGRLGGAKLRDPVETVLVSEDGVEDDDGDGMGAEHRDGVGAADGRVNDILMSQRGTQRLPDGRVVIDDQDGGMGRRRGERHQHLRARWGVGMGQSVVSDVTL